MQRVAVLLELSVSPASQDQYDTLDALVGQAMMEAGGPPAGLMSHVVCPQGEGFSVAQVWRTEVEGLGYLDAHLRPLLDRIGLTASPTTARPVWSFARP
jgi:hypothetical protein